jgi:hypothetical protein
MPLLLAVSAILKQMAFAFAPASLTEKSQFFLPRTLGEPKGRFGTGEKVSKNLRFYINNKISHKKTS